MVIETNDFQTITASALKLFEERVATAEEAFELEAARLESQVVQLYAIAALLARREPDLDKVAAIWDAMILACDAVAEKIQALSVEQPFHSAAYDKILDVRNKATRLRDLHG